MDLLPIKPASTNKVDSAINLANDGGSKSNTGYISKRGSEEKEKAPSKGDEVKLSNSSKAENIDEEKEFLDTVKNYLNKIKAFILKLLGFKKKEIRNIYEENIQ